MRSYFLALVISLLIYSGSFGSYFSQDDFFHLKYSQAHSLNEFVNFFNPLPVRPYAFYRPLARETFNFFMYKLFQLDPVPFHLIQFAVFAILLYSAHLLLTRLTQEKRISNLAIMLYALSAIHLGTFYYLSSIQILLAVIFCIFSLYAFVSRKIALSVILFLLGLMSHEISYTTPILLLIARSHHPQFGRSISLKPFVLLTAFFLAINIILIKPPTPLEYQPSLSLSKIANNSVWYLLWAGGLPEFLVDYVTDFRINPKIISLFPFHFWTMAISALIFSTTLIVSSITHHKKSYVAPSLPHQKIVMLGIAWFISTILPMLLLPSHKFIYYLVFPTLGLSLALSAILSRQNLLPRTLMLVSFTILNLNSISWGSKTYWPIGRGKTALKLMSQIKSQYPSLQAGAVLYIQNDPAYSSPSPEWGGTAKQASIALSGSDAIQLLYEDFSLQVYYEDVDPVPDLPYLEHVARI